MFVYDRLSRQGDCFKWSQRWRVRANDLPNSARKPHRIVGIAGFRRDTGRSQAMPVPCGGHSTANRPREGFTPVIHRTRMHASRLPHSATAGKHAKAAAWISPTGGRIGMRKRKSPCRKHGRGNARYV